MPDIANVEQAASWDGPAGDAWVAREEFQNTALAAHSALLMRAASIGVADHVLDVGCGTGDTTRACGRLARDGDALGVDLSTVMLARARERALAEGIGNVAFEQADAQVHPFEARHFDVVLSRFGVMFFADPVAAFANLARATSPGGRLAAVVWQAFARNEWVAVPLAALSGGRDAPAIPDDVPGPFGLADPERVRGVLADAGWSDVQLDDESVPYRYGTDPVTAARHASEIGVFRPLLEQLDEVERESAMSALTESMAGRSGADGVLLDSRVWVVSAVR